MKLPPPSVSKHSHGRGCEVIASFVVERVGGNFQFQYKPKKEAEGFAPSMAMFTTAYSRHLVYPVDLSHTLRKLQFGTVDVLASKPRGEGYDVLSKRIRAEESWMSIYAPISHCVSVCLCVDVGRVDYSVQLVPTHKPSALLGSLSILCLFFLYSFSFQWTSFPTSLPSHITPPPSSL